LQHSMQAYMGQEQPEMETREGNII